MKWMQPTMTPIQWLNLMHWSDVNNVRHTFLKLCYTFTLLGILVKSLFSRIRRWDHQFLSVVDKNYHFKLEIGGRTTMKMEISILSTYKALSGVTIDFKWISEVNGIGGNFIMCLVWSIACGSIAHVWYWHAKNANDWHWELIL